MKRVVVTGIGAVTPLGLNAQDTWKNLIQGQSGVGRISLWDPTLCSAQIAAEVKGYDVTQYIDRKEMRKMGRFIHFSIGACMEAYKDSGLADVRNQIPAERIGINIGAGMGGLGEIEETHKDLLEKGFKRITPFLIPQIIPNLASGNVAIMLNLKGPNICNVTACASSAHSIGESYHMIVRGDADVMIAGGAEAVISPLGIGAFAQMRALSTRNEEPTRASRPYDVDRDGFVMGEGAATLVLEDYDVAKKRGAKIYGEIISYGLSGDAYHMTLPAPEGEGGYRAMEMALKYAEKNHRIDREKIGYINTHGTSTPAGDVEEARAIRKLFPKGPEHLHLSSTKSMTGHLLGAAGAVEALFGLLAIRDSVVPPTINLEKMDPALTDLGLHFTPLRAVEKKIDYVLSNSFGFGGTNACVILGRI